MASGPARVKGPAALVPADGLAGRRKPAGRRAYAVLGSGRLLRPMAIRRPPVQISTQGFLPWFAFMTMT